MSASLVFGMILFLSYLGVAILLVMYQKEILNTSFQNLENENDYNQNVSGNVATATTVEDDDGNISI